MITAINSSSTAIHIHPSIHPPSSSCKVSLPTCVIWSNPVDVYNGDKAMGRSLAAIMPHDGGIRPAGRGRQHQQRVADRGPGNGKGRQHAAWPWLPVVRLLVVRLLLRPSICHDGGEGGWPAVGRCVMDGMDMDGCLHIRMQSSLFVRGGYHTPARVGFLSPRKVTPFCFPQSRNYAHICLSQRQSLARYNVLRLWGWTNRTYRHLWMVEYL